MAGYCIRKGCCNMWLIQPKKRSLVLNQDGYCVTMLKNTKKQSLLMTRSFGRCVSQTFVFMNHIARKCFQMTFYLIRIMISYPKNDPIFLCSIIQSAKARQRTHVQILKQPFTTGPIQILKILGIIRGINLLVDVLVLAPDDGLPKDGSPSLPNWLPLLFSAQFPWQRPLCCVRIAHCVPAANSATHLIRQTSELCYKGGISITIDSMIYCG